MLLISLWTPYFLFLSFETAHKPTHVCTRETHTHTPSPCPSPPPPPPPLPLHRNTQTCLPSHNNDSPIRLPESPPFHNGCWSMPSAMQAYIHTHTHTHTQTHTHTHTHTHACTHTHRGYSGLVWGVAKEVINPHCGQTKCTSTIRVTGKGHISLNCNATHHSATEKNYLRGLLTVLNRYTLIMDLLPQFDFKLYLHIHDQSVYDSRWLKWIKSQDKPWATHLHQSVYELFICTFWVNISVTCSFQWSNTVMMIMVKMTRMTTNNSNIDDHDNNYHHHHYYNHHHIITTITIVHHNNNNNRNKNTDSNNNSSLYCP